MLVYWMIWYCYCFLSGFKCTFSCIVQYSLYHTMDTGTMWHCTLVSITPLQYRTVLGVCVFLVLSVIRCSCYWSHRYGRPQAACREPAGSYDKTTRTAICFEHKTHYLLIRVPYTRIVVFWHISNIPSMISQSQVNCNTPTFYIAAIFVQYCYTTGSWLL